MAVNKVIYGGNILVDLTGVTVTAADLADGAKAVGADGNPIVGIMQKVPIDAKLSSTSTNPVQNKVIYNALQNKVNTNDIFSGFSLNGSHTKIEWREITQIVGSINAFNYTGTAAKATQDGAGNVIVDTYAKKTDIPSPVTVDAELSSTSENPVQNKAVATALDNKHDKNADVLVGTTNGRRLGFDNKNCLQCNLTEIGQSPVQIRLISNGQDMGNLLVEKSLTNDNYAFAGTDGNHDGEAGLVPAPTIDDDGYFLKSDGTWAALNEYGKLSQVNTWTARQTFNESILKDTKLTRAIIYRETYQSEYGSGDAVIPSKSTMCYTATGATTLDMTDLVDSLLSGNKTTTVFTAYITADADYALTILNAGKLKYVGSASDVAITSAGLLLNIMLMKDAEGNVASLVQANKLS